METSLDSSSDSLAGVVLWTGFSAAAAVTAFMGTTPCSLSIICLNASFSEEHCRKVSEEVNWGEKVPARGEYCKGVLITCKVHIEVASRAADPVLASLPQYLSYSTESIETHPLAIISLSLEYSEALLKANTVTLNIPGGIAACHRFVSKIKHVTLSIQSSEMKCNVMPASSSGASFFAWQRRARLPLRAHFRQKRDVWVRGRCKAMMRCDVMWCDLT